MERSSCLSRGRLLGKKRVVESKSEPGHLGTHTKGTKQPDLNAPRTEKKKNKRTRISPTKDVNYKSVESSIHEYIDRFFKHDQVVNYKLAERLMHEYVDHFRFGQRCKLQVGR
jgi:hypothetical protein